MKKEKTNKAEGEMLTRREFLRHVGVMSGIALTGLGRCRHKTKSSLAETSEVNTSPEEVRPIPTRPLGATGFNATVIGMGGIYIVNGSVEEGISVLNRAFELGINYFDTASQYGGGESERRYGIWLSRLTKEERDKIFVATKTLSRAYDKASEEIEASLNRLQSDYVDLLQVHSINDLDTWRTVRARNGALKAIEEAKRDGRARHVGITGHKDPSVLLTALEDFPFECVLMTLGIEDRFVGSSFAKSLDKFVEKGVGIIAMKVFADGHLIKAGANLEKCIHYVLSLPITTAIIGMGTPQQVEENVSWVHSYKGMTEEEIETFTEEVKELIEPSTIWWKR